MFQEYYLKHFEERNSQYALPLKQVFLSALHTVLFSRWDVNYDKFIIYLFYKNSDSSIC